MKKLAITTLALAAVVAAGFLIYNRSSNSAEGIGTATTPQNEQSSVGEQDPLTVQSMISSGDLARGNPEPLPRKAPSSEILERFRASRTCAFDGTDLEGYQSASIECKAIAGIERLADDYKRCSAFQAERDQAIARLKEQLKANGCDTDPAKLARNYFEATREAARAGDPDAQLCYLESNFGTVYTPQDQQRYAREAPAYISEAFRRGDWRVVALLSQDTYPTGLLGQVAKPDVQTLYRLNRLLRRGATGEYAVTLDVFARTLTTRPQSAEIPFVDTKQAAAADRWVDDMYSNFFKGSPPLNEAPVVCKK